MFYCRHLTNHCSRFDFTSNQLTPDLDLHFCQHISDVNSLKTWNKFRLCAFENFICFQTDIAERWEGPQKQAVSMLQTMQKI
jgi:hypothetical protein